MAGVLYRKSGGLWMAERKIAVLVVEDEALVRINIVAELEDRGMHVLEAGNAHEAIAILGDNPVVNVMFTDVDMPGGIDGLELARIVKERYPPIQVIVTSGLRNVAERELPVEGRFFSKPYVSQKVIQTILEIAGTTDGFPTP
jgi:two-component system, response regulator PdtaR